MEPDRRELQKRIAFQTFCKKVIYNEARNAYKALKRRQRKEVIFSDLSPQEERQIYSIDTHSGDEEEATYLVSGKYISTADLTEALNHLPDKKKKAILLYYFSGLSDAEIGKLLCCARSTVQSRRTSGLELLRQYLSRGKGEGNEI